MFLIQLPFISTEVSYCMVSYICVYDTRMKGFKRTSRNRVQLYKDEEHNLRLNNIVIPQYAPALACPAASTHVPHPATLPLQTSLILYGIIHMCV